MNKDDHSSWFRLFVTVALDWRLVMAIAVLIGVLLLKR